MPVTAAWLNSYYHTSYDVNTLSGNALLAASYLSYYYKYYTSVCGVSGCNWDTVWPGASDNATIRDIVISVYNEGAGTMSNYGILNWGYVNNVLAFYHNRYGGSGN
jgi:hypothetical protein